LLIYRYRTSITPDIEGKKLLFVSHFAGRGPCFYWFSKEDKTVMTAWAKEISETHSDEKARTNAFRFLIESGDLPFQLPTVISSFPYYEDKEELARYIKRFARPSDRDVLLKLSSDKREEVSLAAEQLVVQMFPKVDETLKKMAISTSASKTRLLRFIIRNVAQEENLSLYRDFANARDRAEQVLSIYCLGEVGNEQDLKRILKWMNEKKRSKAIRAAGWFSIARIANHLQDCDNVWSLINKRERVAKTAALAAMTREGIGPHFGLLFSKGFVGRYNLSEKMLEIAAPGDNDVIRSYLSTARLDYPARDLVLALCKIGSGSDFQFLFRLFRQHKDKIDFHNHVRVADSVATICTRRQSQGLKRFLKSEEFWSYILPEQRTTQNGLPIADSDNQAFMRRVIAACVIENSSAKDVGTLIKLVRHYYKWIAYKAGERLSELGGPAELDQLTEALWKFEDKELDDADPAFHALCALDKKCHLDD
jgi:HEAT repeat protein